MSQPLVRHPENRKFSHAAAAMGAFWARARKIEARRLGRMRHRLPAGTRAAVGAPTVASAAAPQH